MKLLVAPTEWRYLGYFRPQYLRSTIYVREDGSRRRSRERNANGAIDIEIDAVARCSS